MDLLKHFTELFSRYMIPLFTGSVPILVLEFRSMVINRIEMPEMFEREAYTVLPELMRVNAARMYENVQHLCIHSRNGVYNWLAATEFSFRMYAKDYRIFESIQNLRLMC